MIESPRAINRPTAIATASFGTTLHKRLTHDVLRSPCIKSSRTGEAWPANAGPRFDSDNRYCGGACMSVQRVEEGALAWMQRDYEFVVSRVAGSPMTVTDNRVKEAARVRERALGRAEQTRRVGVPPRAVRGTERPPSRRAASVVVMTVSAGKARAWPAWHSLGAAEISNSTAEDSADDDGRSRSRSKTRPSDRATRGHRLRQAARLALPPSEVNVSHMCVVA